VVENLPQLIQEYKDARGLTPIKVALLGPPASGKTYLAKKIAEHYEIHYIDVDTVVKDAVARMVSQIPSPFIYYNPKPLNTFYSY
jgi:adenylate kinase